MECHIEQVLYRDQRTIKTRYLDEPCLLCRTGNNDFLSRRFYPAAHHHHQTSPCAKCNLAYRTQGGASKSSLNIYCHNQYCSEFKRLTLNRTENRCGCEDVISSGISERRRRRGVATCFKKLQNVLLLSTYLSLLTLPNMHALPTKVCNPPSASDSPYGFWVNPCGYDFKPIGEPPKEMNVTAVNVAIRSATTALFRARYLKDQFRNQTIAKIGTDPEITYSSIPTYEWLPQLPKISSEEELKLHLSSLDWQENILTIYKYLQNISVPLEQLVIDINQDQKPCPCEELCNNFNIMEGLMRNVLCELYDAMADNNLKVTENVTRDIMPDLLRGARKSKTDRNVRDWIVLRELEKILEYTLAACDYLVSQSA